MVGVFTDEHRVRFVDKYASECGDGKPHCMLATLDQIAEIFLRVEDAWFIQGNIFTATGDPEVEPALGYKLDYPEYHSDDRSYAVDDTNFIYRGYTTPVEGDGFGGPATISLHNDPYLAAEYDRGDTQMWRDVGDNERGVFVEGDYFTSVLPYWNERSIQLYSNSFSLYQDASTEFTNANFFSLTYFDYDGFTDVETKIAAGTASVVFSGEIAVVKANPADGFYAPTNKFYIGVKFYLNATDAVVGGLVTASTDITDISGTPVTPCNYVIRLANDIDLTCPVYAELWPVGSEYVYVGGEDFIHKAQSWFPCAKLGGPIWRTTDGTKI